MKRARIVLIAVIIVIIAAVICFFLFGKEKPSDKQNPDTSSAVSETVSAALTAKQTAPSDTTVKQTTTSAEPIVTEDIPEEELTLKMEIAGTPVTVEWEDNESVEALKELCKDGGITIQLSMYGGFEQVGPIGASLPRNDVQITTGSGDIVLYSGNQIVVFYGSNSWSYTKLGHITDSSGYTMEELLGNGDVSIKISLS